MRTGTTAPASGSVAMATSSADRCEPAKERATVITALHAYEAALEQAGGRHRNA